METKLILFKPSNLVVAYIETKKNTLHAREILGQEDKSSKNWRFCMGFEFLVPWQIVTL